MIRATLIALVMMALCGVPAQALLISVNPATQYAASGDLVTVDLVADTQNDRSLYSWTVDVSWHPWVLSMDSTLNSGVGVAPGPFLGQDGAFHFVTMATNSPDNSAGFIDNLTGTILGPGAGVQGTGVIATLTFLATSLPWGPTSSLIELSNGSALDDLGESLNVELADGEVNLGTIPEPATALLVTLGAAALAYRRRRSV